MRKFGLIGYPLSHSFSQQYFHNKFQSMDEELVYENFPIESLDELADVIRKNPNLKGLNVTIPHKTSIIKLLDDISNEAKSIQAVNTVLVEWVGDSYKLTGYNTDVIGFKASIEPHASGHSNALILGTGGAAKAAYHVLEEMDIECEFVSRSTEAADFTYDDLTEDTVWQSTLIINCSPVGMYPLIDQAPGIPYTAITPEHVLFDMIYNPAETVFLKNGKARGATCINGQEMLERQAEESWLIWNKD